MKTGATTPFLPRGRRAAVAMGMLLTTTLRAATYTWAGLNGATWNTTATNWTPSGASWSALGNSATFLNQRASVVVSGTVFVDGINFGSSGVPNSPAVTGGTIVLGSGGIGTTSGNPTFNLALQVNASANFQNVILGASSTLSAYSAGTKTVTYTPAGGNTWSGTISDGAGQIALIKKGAGTLTLDGSGANTYSGPTTVNTGILSLKKSTLVNAIGGNLTINSGGDVEIIGIVPNADQIPDTALVTVDSGGFLSVRRNETIGGLTGGGTVRNNFISPVTAQVLTIGGGDATSTFTGALTDGGAPLHVTKTGGGILTLSGANTHTGATTINQGTLELSGSGTLNNSSTVTIGGGAVMKLSRNGTWGNHTTTASSPILVNTGGVLQSNNSHTTIVNPTLAGGTILLNGGVDANYPAFSIKGTLTVSGASASSIDVGTGANNRINLGTNAGGGATVFDVADVTSSSAVDLTVNPVLKNNLNPAGTLEVVSGLTKNGAGTLQLNGVNLYTGTTTVQEGKLILSGSSPAAGLIQVMSGATLGGSGIGGEVTVGNDGRLAPGDVIDNSLNLAKLTLNTDSELDFELGAPWDEVSLSLPGSENDHVHITGELVLSGKLNVTPRGGFSAVPGSKWLLMTTDIPGSITDGPLTLGAMPTLNPGQSFVLDTTTYANAVLLVVVPEAGTASLMVAGLLLMRFLRRTGQSASRRR